MRFKELKTFARNPNGNALDPEAIKALELPMPSDVLEQLVTDHGLNDKYQCSYGDLDLHRIAWTKEPLSIQCISQCSSKFDNYVLQTCKT